MDMSTTQFPTSTEPLVDELARRLHRTDLISWARIAAWTEKLVLSFEQLRLLLALAIEEGPTSVSELASISGLSLDAAYPAIHDLHGRGYLREERRRYSLSNDGRDLVATLDAAHREGVQAYVDQLDPRERQRLGEAFGITVEVGR